MNPASIDKPIVRIPLRIIGIFITFVALFGIVDGTAMAIGGVQHGNIWAMSFGFGVLSSYFGLCGAWLRVSTSYAKMSQKKIAIVRTLLMCGIFSTVLLSLALAGFEGIGGLYGALFFFPLLIVGVILLNATPKHF